MATAITGSNANVSTCEQIHNLDNGTDILSANLYKCCSIYNARKLSNTIPFLNDFGTDTGSAVSSMESFHSVPDNFGQIKQSPQGSFIENEFLESYSDMLFTNSDSSDDSKEFGPDLTSCCEMLNPPRSKPLYSLPSLTKWHEERSNDTLSQNTKLVEDANNNAGDNMGVPVTDISGNNKNLVNGNHGSSDIERSSLDIPLNSQFSSSSSFSADGVTPWQDVYENINAPIASMDSINITGAGTDGNSSIHNVPLPQGRLDIHHPDQVDHIRGRKDRDSAKKFTKKPSKLRSDFNFEDSTSSSDSESDNECRHRRRADRKTRNRTKKRHNLPTSSASNTDSTSSSCLDTCGDHSFAAYSSSDSESDLEDDYGFFRHDKRKQCSPLSDSVDNDADRTGIKKRMETERKVLVHSSREQRGVAENPRDHHLPRHTNRSRSLGSTPHRRKKKGAARAKLFRQSSLPSCILPCIDCISTNTHDDIDVWYRTHNVSEPPSNSINTNHRLVPKSRDTMGKFEPTTMGNSVKASVEILNNDSQWENSMQDLVEYPHGAIARHNSDSTNGIGLSIFENNDVSAQRSLILETTANDVHLGLDELDADKFTWSVENVRNSPDVGTSLVNAPTALITSNDGTVLLSHDCSLDSQRENNLRNNDTSDVLHEDILRPSLSVATNCAASGYYGDANESQMPICFSTDTRYDNASASNVDMVSSTMPQSLYSAADASNSWRSQTSSSDSDSDCNDFDQVDGVSLNLQIPHHDDIDTSDSSSECSNFDVKERQHDGNVSSAEEDDSRDILSNDVVRSHSLHRRLGITLDHDESFAECDPLNLPLVDAVSNSSLSDQSSREYCLTSPRPRFIQDGGHDDANVSDVSTLSTNTDLFPPRYLHRHSVSSDDSWSPFSQFHRRDDSSSNPSFEDLSSDDRLLPSTNVTSGPPTYEDLFPTPQRMVRSCDFRPTEDLPPAYHEVSGIRPAMPQRCIPPPPYDVTTPMMTRSTSSDRPASSSRRRQAIAQRFRTVFQKLFR